MQRVFTLGLAFLFFGLPLFAQEPRTITLTIENDFFTRTDRHYTHGTRFNYYHQENDLPDWSSSFLDFIPLGLDSTAKRIGGEMGQSIYTPEDIDTPLFIQGDRPYAGWHYAGLFLQRRGPAHGTQIQVLDHFQLDLGAIGPESLADETQTWWHDVINANIPKGWNNQLQTEPGLVLSFDRAYKFSVGRAGFGADLIPYAGIALGNITTHGSLGIQLRTGWNMPQSFGPRSPAGIHTDSTGSGNPKWSLYFFTGVEGRAIARNIFLDGNTWHDSHSVDKKPVFMNLNLGASLNIKKFSLTFSFIRRSREFYGQIGDHKFGMASLGWRF